MVQTITLQEISKMINNPQEEPANQNSENNIIHVDLDFDFKFYASLAAKTIFQWIGKSIRWLTPFILAGFVANPVIRENIAPLLLPEISPTEIHSQSSE
jgi:hypothetical protein